MPLPYYNIAYTNQIVDLYEQALQSVWLGNSTVEDVLETIVPEMQKVCYMWAADVAEYQ